MLLHITHPQNVFNSKKRRHGFSPKDNNKMRMEVSQWEDCKDSETECSEILQWETFWEHGWVLIIAFLWDVQM